MFKAKGLLVDKENNRYKTYVSFLGIEFGEWKPLRKFSFVATTQRKGAKNLVSPTALPINTTVGSLLFCVYLCENKSRKALVMKSESKEDAIDLAKGISGYLNIDWINYIKE